MTKFHLNQLRSLTLFIGLASILSAQANEAVVINSFSTKYTFVVDNMDLGFVTRTMRYNSDGSYRFESFSEATGILSFFVSDKILEKSIGKHIKDSLRPDTYVYQRSEGKKDRHVKLSFDWDKNRVTNKINGDLWNMTVPTGALDKLIYQYVMMLDLQKGQTTLEYKIADGGRLKDYQFDLVGKETIDTPLGSFKTVKYKRVNDKRGTVIWFAERLNYLPVRIEQQDNGNDLKMVVTRVKGLKADARKKIQD
ncbi:MAG: DUF3108 domain-containing protein [Gammaproteobacteria bacterium]